MKILANLVSLLFVFSIYSTAQAEKVVVIPLFKKPVIQRSCLAILNSGNSIGDGVYLIDPDGSECHSRFAVYCDMTTDGGGWTLTYKVKNDIDQALNPWWDQVMPGSGTSFPVTLRPPPGHTEGPTASVRAMLTTNIGASEWRALTRSDMNVVLFDMVSSYSGDDGRGLRCFASGTCDTVAQACSSSTTDGHILVNTLGGGLSAGDTGYVCDVGWTGCGFCADYSAVQDNNTPMIGGVKYAGDSFINLPNATTYYFIR